MCADDNLQMLGQFRKEGVGYIDLLVIHYAGKMSPECRFSRGGSNCNPPFSHLGAITKQDTQDTWRALEKLRDLKVVRSIGVSMFTPEQMQWILDNVTQTFDVYQEMYTPAKHNNTLLAWTKEHNIQQQSRAALEGHISTNPSVKQAAAAHNAMELQVELRWILQQGLPTMSCTNPLSTADVKEVLCAYDFELTKGELHAIQLASCTNKCDSDPDLCNGTCANLVKKFSCANDYCETCQWAGWCDKECGVGQCQAPK